MSFALGLTLFLFLVALILYVISIFRFPSLRTYKLAQKLPGPNKWWILGIAFDLVRLRSKDILPFMKSVIETHPGPVCRTWLLGIPWIYVADPEFVKETVGNVNNLQKGFEYEALKSYIGNGLVAVDVPTWKERRKLLAPAFNNKRIFGKMSIMNKHARIMVDRLKAQQGKPVDIFAITSVGILQLFLESALEVEVTDIKHLEEFLNSAHRGTNAVVDKITKFPLKDWMFGLTKMGKQLKISAEKGSKLAEWVIKERRSFLKTIDNELDEDNLEKERDRSFIDILIKQSPKNKCYFTDTDIRDEITTFSLAGHDSTAVTIQFVLLHLALDQEIEEKAYEEQYAIFGESDRDVTENDIREMHYLTQVIQETLRLYPSLPIITRELQEDAIVGDVVLPKGSNVVASPYILHRQEKLYPNPEKFDPERFSAEEIQKRHPFAYIPFGAGPRGCIGKNMGIANLKVVLATIIRNFKMEKVTEREEVELEMLIFLSACNQVMIRFIPRN